MIVGGASARAFRLRGGIPMEAAQTNVYHTPASSATITRSIGTHIPHSLAKQREASKPSS